MRLAKGALRSGTGRISTNGTSRAIDATSRENVRRSVQSLRSQAVNARRRYRDWASRHELFWQIPPTGSIGILRL
jgi:hypothetical protein